MYITDKIAYINLTSHPLQFAYAGANEIKEYREHDFIVPVDETINVRWQDTIKEEIAGVKVIARKPVIDDTTKIAIESTMQKYIKGIPEGRIGLIFVSLPTLTALKEIGYPISGENYRIGTVVVATDRKLTDENGRKVIYASAYMIAQ